MADHKQSNSRSACSVLIATRARLDSLVGVSLPSISRQVRKPDLIVLVADEAEISDQKASELAGIVSPVELVGLRNSRAPGVSGAWNTGLAYLARSGFDGFVAILDDDDEWDNDHLDLNLATAESTGANVVISGLRMMMDGRFQTREILAAATDRMFLVGNPGWQGSNTFVSMAALLAVGGFRDGLPSANDRDLAIRLLRWSGVETAFTGRWTATWHMASDRASLSSRRSEAKLRGLRWFLQIYRQQMTDAELLMFFARAAGTFGIAREELTEDPDDRPPHCEPRGDLA